MSNESSKEQDAETEAPTDSPPSSTTQTFTGVTGLLSKIKMTSAVPRTYTFSLDEMELPRVKADWGWGEVSSEPKPAPKTVMVKTEALQHGDYLVARVNRSGLKEGWDVYFWNKGSVLGWGSSNKPGTKVRISPGFFQDWKNDTWEVRLPRPEPEVNEFGPVSP